MSETVIVLLTFILTYALILGYAAYIHLRLRKIGD
jgi:hypothetical protein